MKEIESWLINSNAITQIAEDPYRSSFEHELELRKQLVALKNHKAHKIHPDITIGDYKIIGRNPDNKNSCYIGTLSIEYENNAWYASWFIYGETHSAYGMQVNDHILVFNFSFVDANKRAHTGLVSYTFLSNRIVHGEWMEEGEPGLGIEELRRIPPSEQDADDDKGHDANFGFSLN